MADDYTNTGKQTEKQKVQEITQKLEQGIKDVFESEKYKEYLTTMSKFHHYSLNNTMLIAMQKPDATLVAGYQAWQKNFDRHVKRGEKGIRILAPAPYKIKEEREKTDPVTGEIVLDKNGMPVIEEVEVKLSAFRVVPVFDVSQTEGKELPDIGVSELSGSVEDYEDFMQALTEISPVSIGYEQIDGDAKGYFHTEEHRIALQEGMSQSQTVKTAVHEVAHAKLHDRELNSDLEESIPKDRNTKEVEAESVAYTVCQHFGIDTSDYSFGYIAGWSSGKGMKELKSSLDTIRKTSSELITGISERLQELKRDRGQEQDKENLLLIENSDLTKYSLLRVSGMDVEQIAEALSVMGEDDKLSIAAYLESKGAWTAEIGNEDTKEFGVYHLDVRYNTDTSEIKTFSDKHTIEQELEQNPAGKEGENMNLDQVSYYVIENIPTWADNSQNRSKLERYDSLSDAMEQFGKYRADVTDESEDRAKTTIGASVNGIEFDVAYAIKSDNVLSLDFTHSQTAQESSHFMEALQTLCAELPVDKVRVHRTMTPEEKKEFVKQRFQNQLKQSGIEDDSFYMTRFDMLYEQGKMNDLMPTANQQQLVEDVPYTEWDNPYFQMEELEQMAFMAGDKFVSIQVCDDGYDYSIFNTDYTLFDGGMYDDAEISIHAALKEVLEDIGVKDQKELVPVDYDGLMEKTEAAEQAKIQAKSIVSDFRAKTNEMFHEISGLNAEDMEMTARAHILSKLDDFDLDAQIVDVVVSGSWCRGLEQEGSDIDIVVEYKGSANEDTLFAVLNEDELKIGGVRVDINPITEGKTGTLETYLPGMESYLEQKRVEMENAVAETEKVPEKTITWTVAECGEFHDMGELHENVETVEQAIDFFNKISPERMHGIPSIGIRMHTEGTEEYEDVQMDVFSGGVADLEMLEYVPDITDDPKAVAMIQELIDKLPDIEVRGSLEKWQAGFLATEIDQLSYDYDTNQYKDTVEDREAQVANITEDIRSGNVGYLNDFLNAIIAEEVREGITDIFGQGTDISDSEAVQTARKAKELLDKLAEYKPLAKIEELEEQNYNMIDNVLNNGAEKKEDEKAKTRVSVKEKLAKKKAVIEKRDKAEKNCPEKDAEKKAHREI